MFIILGHWHSLLHVRHFLRKGREENQKFIKCTMDFLPIPDYVIKKGRPHGHRYGKKPGDREHYIANQLKKVASFEQDRFRYYACAAQI